MNKYELPYSAEIRTKHCEPDDEINFGERYCTICGCVLNFDEEDICNNFLFESSRPLSDEEIKTLKRQKDETTLAILTISGSSKGRTSYFDCDNAGSIPAPETINKELDK